MKWLKTLNNPFILAVQGFVAGAVIFFATHPEAAQVSGERSAPSAETAKAESSRNRA